METTAVILAAGQGTRMHSSVPKVLHPLMGKPMISYSLETARHTTGSKPVVVIGHRHEEVQQVIGDEAHFVVQEPQLGTGDAIKKTEQLLRSKSEYLLVTTADMPLVTSETLKNIVQMQSSFTGPATILTVLADDPRGFGRVVRDEDGNVKAIVEEAQATPDQLKILELNASVYCFKSDWLWDSLPRIPISQKGEYYLTDLVGIAAQDGLSVQAHIVEDPLETIGINTRVHLAEAVYVLRQRLNHHWMEFGVTLIDPQTTYIESDVAIGKDTIIWPNTHIQGNSIIGEGCNIGPNSLVRDTHIGDHCKILSSVVEHAILKDNVEVGPFGHLRKGAHLDQGVHMGNFGEVKNSYLGPDTKMGHFSYLGDTTTGPDVNIGAGTITCNYDGEKKHPTEIGAGAFIGSDTMLVAPVKIGANSRTGAGSVITKDVPPDTLSVGAPAKSIRKIEKHD